MSVDPENQSFTNRVQSSAQFRVGVSMLIAGSTMLIIGFLMFFRWFFMFGLTLSALGLLLAVLDKHERKFDDVEDLRREELDLQMRLHDLHRQARSAKYGQAAGQAHPPQVSRSEDSDSESSSSSNKDSASEPSSGASR